MVQGCCGRDWRFRRRLRAESHRPRGAAVSARPTRRVAPAHRLRPDSRNTLRSVGTRDHRLRDKAAIDHFRQRSNRNLTAAAHFIQQSSLTGCGCARGWVIQEGDVLPDRGIAFPNLDGQRTLAGGGTHQLRGQQPAVCTPVLPRRFSPAAARITASYSPASSLRRRVSTFPRRG